MMVLAFSLMTACAATSFCGTFENEPVFTWVSVPMLGLSGVLPGFTTQFVVVAKLCALVPASPPQLVLFFSVPLAVALATVAPSPVPAVQVMFAVIVVVTTAAALLSGG